MWHERSGTSKCGTIMCTIMCECGISECGISECGTANLQLLSLYHYINTSSMPRRIPTMDSDDEENEADDLPPPQKTSIKPRKDSSKNVQTRGASERTLSVKQQAISKCFHSLLSIG
jgi:hypothetical protein